MNEQPDLFDNLDPERSFGGATFEPELDFLRLKGQLARVYDLMKDGQWRTLRQIADITGGAETAISARLRDFRKWQFGTHTVERERVIRGLFRYRLLVREDLQIELDFE
jgi:hypothetical protein